MSLEFEVNKITEQKEKNEEKFIIENINKIIL